MKFDLYSNNNFSQKILFSQFSNFEKKWKTLSVKVSEELTDRIFDKTRNHQLSNELFLTTASLLYAQKYFNTNIGKAIMFVPQDAENIINLPHVSTNDSFKDSLNNLVNGYRDIISKGDIYNFKLEDFEVSKSNVLFGKNNDHDCLETILPSDFINIYFEYENQNIIINISFNEEIHNRNGVSHFMAKWGLFINRLLLKNDVQVSRIPVLNKEDQKVFIRTGKKSAVTATLTSLLVKQCASRGDNIAIKEGAKLLSYAELENLSNKISSYLYTQPIPESGIVYVCMNRSIELIVTLVGILERNASFCILDPDLPKEQFGRILNKNSYNILITTKELHESVLKGHNSLYYHDIINCEVKENIAKENINPLSIAYVIYTSGTTGEPKGVLVSHKAICSRMYWMHETYNIDKESVTLIKSPLTFDPFICEVFRTLTAGGVLGVIPYNESAKNPNTLVNYINLYKITNMDLVPSPLLIFLSHLKENLHDLEKVRTLQFVFAGAETLKQNLAQDFDDLFTKRFNTILVNTWGATETVVDVIHFKFNAGCRFHNIPVGYPINNAKILLLNEQFEQVPDGVIGELFIGGDTIALGYLNDDNLTKKNFVKLPQFDNEKFYKTGDYAFNYIEGPMQFIGRKDHQLNINGIRIETSSIECYLQEDAQVEIVKIMQHNKLGLVAFIKLKDGYSEINENVLIQRLEDRFSKSVIPKRFIQLKSIPLTPNEKVDWKKIEIELEVNKTQEYSTKSQTKLEKELKEIWEEILNEQVSTNDHFFNLGGDSIGIALMQIKIKKNLGIDVPVDKLFHHLLFSQLLELLEDPANYANHNMGITNALEKEYYPTSSSQKQIFFDSQFEGGSIAYNESTSFEISFSISPELVNKSLEHLISRHEILRTEFKLNHEGKLIQRVVEENRLKLLTHFIDVSSDQNTYNSIDNIIESIKSKQFDFTNAPLFKVLLFKIHDECYVLSIIMHHIITDNWSLTVFLKELLITYNALSTGMIIDLPKLEIQFKDFAIWEQNYLKSNEGIKDRDFWIRQLKGMSSFKSLPYDEMPSHDRSYDGNKREIHLSKNEILNFKQSLSENNCTLFMGFGVAITILLHKMSRESDIVFGTPILGRKDPLVVNQLGMYANVIPLRIQINESNTIAQVLEEVRKSSVESFLHGQYPMSKISEAMNIDYSENTNPFFEVALAFQAPIQEHTISKENDQIEEYLPNISIKSKFHWVFNITQNEQGVIVDFEYRKDLFTDETIDKVVTHLKSIITAITSNTQTKIKELKDLTYSQAKVSINSSVKQKIIKVPSLFTNELKEIWKQILNIESVDINEDFFALGGKSLMLIQLIHLVQNKYGVLLQLNDLYKNTTILKMAELIQFEQLNIKSI